MIKIVMDSCGDLPPDLIAQNDIEVVPVNIHFGDQVYREGVDIDQAGVFQRIAEKKCFPSTAQPSPHQFAEVYREVAQEKGATDIISIHVSSHLSGTYASARLAAEEAADEVTVTPFDSHSGSGGQGFMALQAARMAAAGASVKEILERLRNMRENMAVYLVLDTLEFAKLSGRIGTLGASLASMLRIKPLVCLKDGGMEVREKVRTHRRAIDRMLALISQKIGDRRAWVAVLHAGAPKAAEALAQRVQAEFNIQESFVETTSTGIAIHLGPGAVGLVACPIE